MPRFMGFVRMEEGIEPPPQAMFEAMDAYIGEQAAKGVFLDGGGLCIGYGWPRYVGRRRSRGAKGRYYRPVKKIWRKHARP